MRSLPVALALFGLLFTTEALAQETVDGCLNSLGQMRTLDPGEECAGDEELVTVVQNSFITPHAEAMGNNGWRAFINNGSTHVVRNLETNLYQVRASGLPEVEIAQMARVDLDNDGVAELAWVDPGTQALLVFYDFDLDDGEVLTNADASIQLTGEVTLDAYEEAGVEVLVVCDDKTCTNLSSVVRGEEPPLLP